VAVESHQTFQDVYNKCYAWIRMMNDKLASCSEGQSDKDKLQANIDQIKVIFTVMQIFEFHVYLFSYIINSVVLI